VFKTGRIDEILKSELCICYEHYSIGSANYCHIRVTTEESFILLNI